MIILIKMFNLIKRSGKNDKKEEFWFFNIFGNNFFFHKVIFTNLRRGSFVCLSKNHIFRPPLQLTYVLHVNDLKQGRKKFRRGLDQSWLRL